MTRAFCYDWFFFIYFLFVLSGSFFGLSFFKLSPHPLNPLTLFSPRILSTTAHLCCCVSRNNVCWRVEARHVLVERGEPTTKIISTDRVPFLNGRKNTMRVWPRVYISRVGFSLDNLGPSVIFSVILKTHTRAEAIVQFCTRLSIVFHDCPE